ncbi:MAG: fibronectin type III domain-containing protein, partial [Acidobacteriota bacterium]|nr:fibronectin type III domain-containing protein [Acidobacteriota bacterium]
MTMQRECPRLLWRVVAAGILAALRPALVEGQALLRFETDGSDGAGTVRRFSASTSTNVRQHRVTVDLGLIRAGPPAIEFPTPTGRLLRAERTAFEDRGNGNAFWAGRIAGTGYDTFVLTLQDGHVIGTYGEPGRFKFELTSRKEAGVLREPVGDATGAGGGRARRMACEARPPPLPGGSNDPRRSRASGGPRGPPPDRVAGAQMIGDATHQLDVLVLYTRSASSYWTTSDAAAVQAAVDYTNTVYRNGALGAELRLAASAPAPAELSTVAQQGRDWLDPIPENAGVKLLRETHEADVVILFTHDSSDWARCGAAYLRGKEHTTETIAPWAYGFANLSCHSSSRSGNSIFAHEIGHVLGGNHDPDGGGNLPADQAVQPYAFGHTDTAPDPDIATIMSYGTNNSVREPYFSNVRVTPNGWSLGIANQRENERAIKQTLPSATQMSDWLPPAPPSGLTGTAALVESGVSVSLNWQDNSSGESAIEVQYKTWLGTWADDKVVGATLAADTTSVTLTGLPAATRLVFRVVARNAHGENVSEVWSVRTPGAGLPTAPSGLTAVALDPNRVRLTWTDNAVEETGYEVRYKTGAGTWTTSSLSADTEAATVTGLLAATSYTFQVGAVNTHGTARSDQVTVSTPAFAAPSAPSNLISTSANSTSVGLSWTDNSTDETGFDVEHRTGGGDWTAAATAAAGWTRWLVSGLASSTTYEFRVVARNASGSAPSNVVSRKTGPPPPSNISARNTGGEWRLQWTDNSNDETEFDVYYQTTGDADGDSWSYLKSPPANTESTNTGLTGANYFFTMFAYVDASTASSPSHIVTVGSFPRPAIPQALLAVGAGSTSADVRWTDNSANEGGFRVEHRTMAADGTAGVWTASVVDADTTSTVVFGLTPSGTYEFRVTAFILAADTDAARLSRGSTFVARMPPAAPTGLAATVQGTMAELTWTDNAVHETGFRVEYRETGTSAWTVSSTPAADAVSATVTGLNAGNHYEFRVVATNANGDSTPSDVVSTAPAGPPAAPSGVAVSPTGSTSVIVTWADNSSGETGFDVEHRSGSDAWATTTVAANVSSAPITGLTASTTYDFRVSARNAHGSAAGPTVSRTMPPPPPSGLTATAASPTSVDLSWTDESSDETGFTIQYKPATASSWSTFGVAAPEDAESATVTGLAARTTYNFQVLATHSSNGLSTPSNVATVGTPGPPSAPSGLSSTSANSTSVGLSWTDDSTDETGFDVEHRTGGGDWTAAATAAAGWTRWLVSGLASSTTYEFRVVARNASGSAPSNVVSRKTGPPPPSNISARNTGGEWRLQWTDNSNDETEFDVYYQTTGDADGDSWSYLKSPPANTESTNTGLTGANYFFTMFAYVDASTASSPSHIVTVGSFPRPAIPQALLAVGAGSTSADVRWTDNSANEGGFRVEHRTMAADGTAGVWTASVVDADTTSTVVFGLTPSGTYEFRVTAFILAADTDAARLSRGSTFVARMPPAAPTGLAATMRGATAELTWTDNAAHETGFRVEYRETGTSRWTVSSTPAADAVSASVAGLTAGHRYEFRIVATNANGDSTPSDAASAALTVAGLTNGTVAENVAYTSATPTVSGHRGTVTWTKEGADAADFTIASATGALSMVARDHESPADANKDNVYEVTVKATDQDGIEGTASITVTVTDVNEAPAFSTAAALAISVPEGTTGDIGSPVTATDPEGASLTYSLTGTDASAFRVSAAGQISLATGTVLNHEQKSSYSFNVVVSDGATQPLTATRAVTVTVTDVDETLTIAGLASGTVAENAAYTSATPTVSGHRGTVTWTKEGADAADFTIASATGVLKMVARNHEDARDAN